MKKTLLLILTTFLLNTAGVLLGARREERAGDRTFGHIHSREKALLYQSITPTEAYWRFSP